jgi:hypothetical protein
MEIRLKRAFLLIVMLALVSAWGMLDARAEAIPGGSLEPSHVEKWAAPMVIPPAMPRTDKINEDMGKNIDYCGVPAWG